MEKRRLVEVAELVGFDGEDYKLNYIYYTDPDGKLMETGNNLTNCEKLMQNLHEGRCVSELRNGFLVNGESARDLNKSTPIKHVGIKDDYNIQSEHLANSEIRYDKYMVDKREKQLLFAGTLVVGTALSVLMYHNVFFSLVLLLFYIKIQEIYAEYMLARRKRALAEQFKDFLFILSTSIGTGRGMRDAIGEAIPGIVGIYGENAILSRS